MNGHRLLCAPDSQIPRVGPCLLSSGYQRARNRSLSDLDTSSQVTGAGLPAQPSFVSSPGSGRTVWYLPFFLLLLQMPWKGPDLLNHAKDEGKPLYLENQESPEQSHDHTRHMKV